MIGKCKICKELKFLTKHSKIGGHQPPFIWICRTPCHDELHRMNTPKPKRNLKYKKGTKKFQKKHL